LLSRKEHRVVENESESYIREKVLLYNLIATLKDYSEKKGALYVVKITMRKNGERERISMN
jgi:TolB-like protein